MSDSNSVLSRTDNSDPGSSYSFRAIRNVLAILPSVIPSGFIYTIRPLNSLARQGKISFKYMLEKDVTAADLLDVDLIIFSRNQEPRFNPLLEEARSAGTAVIYDLDDNFWEIPTELEIGRRHRLPPRLKQTEHYLRNADLVRVYNPLVAEHVWEFNPNVYQAVPGIDFSLVPEKALPKADEKIRIIYLTARGGDDPLYDLFLPDLVDVMRMFPEKVEAVLWKECPPALQGFPNVTIHPVEYDYEKFLTEVSRAGYDIGLAPITQDRFYISKTNTKFRDYGACRIAGIYSKAFIYTDHIEHNQTGILLDQAPGAWREAMLRLIQDEALRTRIQESAFQYVYEHFRQEIMEAEWLSLFDRLSTHKIPSFPVLWQQKQKPEGEPAIPAVPAPPPGKKCLAIDRSRVILPGFQKADFDLNQPFPFDDNTFDLVYASEPLMEVKDLWFTMKEIQRVCKHGAQISIYVPYLLRHLTMAHPKSQQFFNEHTPRFWTRQGHTPVYTGVYASFEGESWGLLEQSNGELDLRCQKITFFYTPEYRDRTEEAKRLARQKEWNVCDHILYHLIAVKCDGTEEELNALEKKLDFYVPPEVIMRQYQEQVETYRKEIDELKTNLFLRASELENYQKRYKPEIDRLQSEIENLKKQLESERVGHTMELTAASEANRLEIESLIKQWENEREALNLEVANIRTASQQEIEKNRESWTEEIGKAKEGTSLEVVKAKEASTAEILKTRETANAEIQRLKALVNVRNRDLQFYRAKAQELAIRLDRIRGNGLYRFASHLLNRSSAWNLLPETYQRLKEDTAAFVGAPEQLLLQPGPDLHLVDYLQYPVQLGRAGLKEIQLAVVMDVPLSEGIMGIELVDASNQILARSIIPAKQVTERNPVVFQFKPVSSSSQGRLFLRVFAREIKLPLRVFELRSRSLGGFLVGQSKPFAGYSFIDK